MLNIFVNKIKVNSMSALGEVLFEKRNEKGIVVRNLAFQTGIDPALISKYEKGNRLPTEDNLKVLAEVLQIPFEEARKMWLAEKVYNLLAYEENAGEILALAESRVAYLSGQQSLTMQELSASIQDKLKQIDDLKAKWQSRRPLNPTQLQKMQEFFNVAYTFESNRIEGNTLTLQETHLVVNEGITIGGKSMREHLEAINHADATNAKVETGVTLSREAASKVELIKGNAEEISTRMGEITSSTAEQGIATNEMARSAERVNSMAQQTDSSLQEALATIQVLASRGDQLKALVSQFRL